MVAGGNYTDLASIGSLIFQVQQLEGEIRHAEQGYSGFVASISINEDRLNKLYDYDYAFVLSAIQLLEATSPPNLVFDVNAPASIQTGLSRVSAAVSDFKQKWAVRMEAIKNILVK
jgi:hypothetical protein